MRTSNACCVVVRVQAIGCVHAIMRYYSMQMCVFCCCCYFHFCFIFPILSIASKCTGVFGGGCADFKCLLCGGAGANNCLSPCNYEVLCYANITLFCYCSISNFF